MAEAGAQMLKLLQKLPMLTGGKSKMVIQYQNKFLVPFKAETKDISVSTQSQSISLDPEKIYLLTSISVLNHVSGETIKLICSNVKNPFGDHSIQFYTMLGKKLQFSNLFCENRILIVPTGTTEKKIRIRLVELSEIVLDSPIENIEWTENVIQNNELFQYQGQIYEEKKLTADGSWKIPKTDYDFVQILGYSCQKQTEYASEFPDLNMKIFFGDNPQTQSYQKQWPKSKDLSDTLQSLSPQDFLSSKFGGGVQGGIYLPASNSKGTALDDFHYNPIESALSPSYDEVVMKLESHNTITTYDAIIGIHLAYFTRKN